MKRTAVPTPATDGEEILVVEVYLISRRFESKIQIPLLSADADKRAFIDQWMALMEAGLKMNGSK